MCIIIKKRMIIVKLIEYYTKPKTLRNIRTADNGKGIVYGKTTFEPNKEYEITDKASIEFLKKEFDLVPYNSKTEELLKAISDKLGKKVYDKTIKKCCGGGTQLKIYPLLFEEN